MGELPAGSSWRGRPLMDHSVRLEDTRSGSPIKSNSAETTKTGPILLFGSA